MTDFYADLGIPRGATAEEIKAAGRKAVKRTHPDAGGKTEDFVKVSTALAVLSDPEKRERYDKSGDAAAPEGSEEAEANTMVAMLLRSLLVWVPQAGQAEAPDPSFNNMRQIVADTIRQSMQNVERERVKTAKSLKSLGEMKRRFRKKGKGPDFVAEALDSIERDLNKALGEAERAIRVHQKAAGVITSYDYAVSSQAQSPGETWAGITGRTFFGNP